MTGISIGNWCSMGMKKGRSRWRRDVIKDVWKMESGNHRRCGRLVGYIGWWKRYGIRFMWGENYENKIYGNSEF